MIRAPAAAHGVPVGNTPGFANDQRRFDLLNQAVQAANKRHALPRKTTWMAILRVGLLRGTVASMRSDSS